MELWAERRRIGLVALGVAWGTLALTLLLAVGQSFVEATNQTISNFGDNLIRVAGNATTLPYRGLASGRAIGLVEADAELLARAVPQAHTVALEYSRGGSNSLRFGQQIVSVPVGGSGPAFQKIRGMIPQAGGRFINERDVREHRRVCFLGHHTKQRLFGDSDPVGARVELQGTPFTVVGVRREHVSVSGYNGDDRDKVMIPYTTFRDLYGWTNISHLMIALNNPRDVDAALDAVYQTLGTRKGFHAHDRDALSVMDYIALRDMINGMLDGNRYLNMIVGIFGLLVAMLGVMNVMYVMVEERSREIGIRMALGARRSQVLRERLSEGIVVTLLGGGVGMALCAGLFALLESIDPGPDVRAYLGHPALSVGLGSAIVVTLGIAGCLAGWFPARRAAMLDPIQTLREE